MQTYPVRADGSSVNGNFGVFACTDICLKIQKPSNCLCVCYLTASFSPSVVEPFHAAKDSTRFSACQVSCRGNPEIDAAGAVQRARNGENTEPVPALLNGPKQSILQQNEKNRIFLFARRPFSSPSGGRIGR